MRKLYALAAGLFFVLVATKTNAQINSQNLFFEDPSITTVINESAMNTDPNSLEETCLANFEVSNAASSPLTKKFTAIPWHSEQNRPAYICWEFGDGTDTCIQYSNTNPGLYTVAHHYQQPGSYEVCVKIVYAGGCVSRHCKEIIVEEFCRADFEKFPITATVNPLDIIFKALPWQSENKKPKRICWYFGDGRDTCIEYPANYTGAYVVRHKYRETGLYQVCIKIFYDGGCEAGQCKGVQITRSDRCGADFERIPTVSANDLLVVGFEAVPPDTNNNVPKVICWKRS